MGNDEYDVIIIGGGPGGLSAALYCARARLKTLVLEEKSKTGGLCATTSEMENYPGVMQESGPGLMQKFTGHAAHFGAEFRQGRVTSLTLPDDGVYKSLHLKEGTTLTTRSVIIATGTRPRVLGIPGEKEFAGRGVSYCATCDADFYSELDVVVVGSGNTAVEESVFLTRYVNSVTMIVIHDEGHLDADRIAREQAYACEKIHFVWNSTVTAILGDDLVREVEIQNVKTGERSRLTTSGVFMFVGTVPQTDWLLPWKTELPLTDNGYIVTNAQQETGIPGVFAVGDVCDKFLRQVVTAAGDGAVAAVAASHYLEQEAFWQQNVLGSPFKNMVLFWSPVEPESVLLMTRLEQEMSQRTGWRLVPVDSYKNQRMAQRYGVNELPTLLCLEHGTEQWRLEHPDADTTERMLEKITV
ncbi:thioredoxin-disulfide reductase [Escherichia coli TA206]|uniref:FAD-dependent oxidoreductase n=1 Tax=Escherichia coli TaxID=562 RepID=UPI0001E8A753|nr:FAD-dependent oxidoreductase [Escherichia coli]EGI25780.1 thioredoxin-disulfide reductase [Escherichia coli TA206]